MYRLIYIKALSRFRRWNCLVEEWIVSLSLMRAANGYNNEKQSKSEQIFLHPMGRATFNISV